MSPLVPRETKPQPLSAREQARYLRASGIDRALEKLNGPYGVRRYLLFFERRGERIVVSDLDCITLAWGGGPPPEDRDGSAVTAVELALRRLHANMALGPRWERGVIGVVRDRDGRVQLFPAFDADADDARLEDLPVPPKPGHPLESPDWLDGLAQWGPRMGVVQARSAAMGADRDDWEIERDMLRFPDGRTFRCRVLATFDPANMRLVWQVSKPLFDGEVFEWREFQASFDAAMEVGLLTTARLSATWMFVGRIDDAGAVLMVAAWE